jgi:phage terminase small subunit
MARPRKPVGLKKIQGTLNVTRDREAMESAKLLEKARIILPPGSRLPVPGTITDPVCRKFWRQEIDNLLEMQVLSRVDLHQLEAMCVTLQKLREIEALFLETEPDSADYDTIEKRFERLGKRFDELAAKFYVSPAARTQLNLTDLQLMKAARELEKETSPVDQVLGLRKAN